MKKTIRDFNLNEKKVIIRVDFNVPIKDSIIQDDNRIKQSLKTINYAIDNGAKVILMSHLGRIKEEKDKIKNTLEPVALRLSELLGKEVIFVTETRGKILEDEINNLQSRQVLLMENTRFEDLNGELESSNDKELSKYWASLGDIFINDAFATSHRNHASNVGIASLLPSGIGFLIEKEINVLSEVLENPKRPFNVILGGAKVKDKIGVIKNLVNIADHILIGGGMAYTFLKASSLPIGKSLVDMESIPFCKEMLEKYSDKIILPIDSINAKEIKEDVKTTECFISDIKEDDIGLDIGYGTTKIFKEYLLESKTVVWNGTVGYSEIDLFAKGTKALCEVLKDIDATKIIGGGDTASAITNLGYSDYMTYISTGGGASLEYLEGKKLPGIEVISDKDEK
ncbi:MAG: phosphoglycerate kinase [Bacilli bacterium]|nr:phosphoglycerate kinase [Bacilli bacterium]